MVAAVGIFLSLLIFQTKHILFMADSWKIRVGFIMPVAVTLCIFFFELKCVSLMADASQTHRLNSKSSLILIDIETKAGTIEAHNRNS